MEHEGQGSEAVASPPILCLPPELLLSVFRSLGARDLLSLRVTCHLFHALSHEDASLWGPLYSKTFGTNARPHSKRSRRKHMEEVPANLLAHQFQKGWEWVYKSRRLSLVQLTRVGATCYSRPKVRFPPTRWVAFRDDPFGQWRYEANGWAPTGMALVCVTI